MVDQHDADVVIPVEWLDCRVTGSDRSQAKPYKLESWAASGQQPYSGPLSQHHTNLSRERMVQRGADCGDGSRFAGLLPVNVTPKGGGGLYQFWVPPTLTTCHT